MGNKEIINGVILSPLKKIINPKGDIFHVIKKSDSGYAGFGEVYISTVHFNQIKGWKKHTQMLCNFVVPIGSVKFVLIDKRENSNTFNLVNEFILSPENYNRLTVPFNVYFGFQGLSKNINQIINFANIVHTPNESLSIPLDYEEVNYNWKTI
jgi:dTDP-4-dehydrorhamnose 3,5-epimerase